MEDWRGKNEKQPKTSRKTLLYQKKLLAFLRVSSFFLGLLVLIRPVEAHADVWNLFGWFSFGGSHASKVSFVNTTYAADRQAPALASNNQPPGNDGVQGCDTNLGVDQSSALVSILNPTDTIMTCALDPYGTIFVYLVQSGDNIFDIANRYHVSVNTIRWANSIQNDIIIPGDQLVILPVSGVRHIVKDGDTIASIAKKYNADTTDIVAYNGLMSAEKLETGSEIIIPDGELSLPPAPSNGVSPRFSGLPDLKGYWLRPIAGGINTRATKANPHGIHGNNGVDLSSACHEPVFASAAGTVLIAKDSGWNAGYGKYIVILHPNSVQTLYGHLLSLNVASGQDVSQGETVGLEGNTGNTRGTTGCHVHFEIRGAKNPF